VPILAEMLRRMGFGDDAARAERVWRTLYDRRRGHRLPPRLVQTAGRTIPQVVDETAYQPAAVWRSARSPMSSAFPPLTSARCAAAPGYCTVAPCRPTYRRAFC
jgi:hypothetical protein